MPQAAHTPSAAMIVIGDEILSGRTRDSNMHHLAMALTGHGVPLAEVRVIGDDRAAIIAAVQVLSQVHDHVFTSGGIGPTHDDITAEAVAAAFDAPIGVRDDARAILAAHYAARGTELNTARLRMARIPDGATLIDNTTASADAARELYAACQEKGVGFIDAPVSGGQAGAENGALTVMCGGDEGVYAAAEPVIEAYAKSCKLMGESGAGQITKMVNQICIAGLLQGLSEGMNFGQKAGLDMEKVIDVII
jgi:molybdenum cofactor synthesis domain-containing protein